MKKILPFILLVFGMAQPVHAFNFDLEIYDGLTAEELKFVRDQIVENEAAFDRLIALGECANAAMSREERKVFHAFGHTASANIRTHCIENTKRDAAEYADERFKEFTRTSAFKKLNGCVKDTADAEAMTTLILGQMGVKALRLDAEDICASYGK